MTDLTDAEITEAFEKWKADFKADIDKHIEERMAAFQGQVITKNMQELNIQTKELDQRLRALEERTVVASSRGKMRDHLRRLL
jgi:DNA-binding transcriptional MerR regulator